MEYKRFDDKIVLRLDRFEEITDMIREVSEKENIKLAMISGIGATDDFTVGVYSLSEKKYYTQEFKGAFEIVSLTGSINTKDGEFYTHIHIGCSDKEFNMIGGHLIKANISITCEIIITVIDGSVDRKTQEETGVNLLDF